MKLTPIQSSFAAGEISPLMHGQVDTEGYRSGARTMLNMIADSRGPSFSRTGTSYLEGYTGNDGRIETLQVNSGLFFSLIFVHLKLAISTPAGIYPAEQFISNPFFSSGAVDWTSGVQGSQSLITFAQTNCSLKCDDQPSAYARIDQNFTITDETVAHILTVACTIPDDGEVTISIGTSQGASDIHTATIEQTHYTVEITPGAPHDNLWVRISNDAAGTTSAVHKVMFYASVAGVIDFTTVWPEDEVRKLHLIQAPGGKAIYFCHQNYPVYKLIYDAATGSFSFAAVTFTSPPAAWTGSNWPGTGTFFQGRLWLGGAPEQPETFHASRSGVPEDFTTGGAADGLVFTLAKYGLIKWMTGFKNLIIGTENGEHIATSEGGVLTYNDIEVEQQSSYGSNDVQPKQIGDQIFYMGADGLKVRSMNYQWQDENWMSKDLTFVSEHITASGIRDIAWAQNPGNLFWCVLNNGTLACLTYERGNNVYGWHRHETQGRVLSMSVGSFNGTSLASWLVMRLDGEIYHETFFPDVQMDSSIFYTNGAASTTITGLDHLEGMSVQVITDGAMHPDRVVVGGEIELQTPSLNGVAGLQYTPELEPLPMDKGAPTGSGSGWSKRWNRILLRVLNSAKPLINGTRPATRSPSTPMGTSQPLATEDIEVHQLGADLEASVSIKQDLPLPLTVLAIFGDVEQDSL